MASGGYQAPSLDEPTGFGSDSLDSSDRASGVASAPLFGIDYKRHEDLKMMLDSSKDGPKLDAMKLIIGMIAKGKDCSDLFPAVVKNVVSKNTEIKKLVYVYLVRYAEEQQDVALLSISTFQKGLKDPNQLIRASALRVLSSIRVPIIAPIMMLAIKESVTDMSPYVRKTAATAIPKLFSLDPEQKEQLEEVIEKLLKDQTTLVAGSVVMAFETVCPERIDLIHKNYRKLCNLLVDVDEWGQATILNMLTRYARTQFIDPNKELVEDAPFYSESESEEEEDRSQTSSKSSGHGKAGPKKKPYTMDPDHRLLLRNCKPLLQSRNASVVMAVAQLYHHVAPRNEVAIIAKPLIRLLKGHREVQSVVLSNIATMSAQRSSMFEPYLKSFYVHHSDPTHIRLLKLDIMANVAGETSIHSILREFRTYISSSDKEFAAATIQAIGRVACSLSDVTETCLHGLMSLLSHKDEAVAAESVVVIKKLLQLQPKENRDLIVQVARMADKVTVPLAKASILWLVGEYCSLVPKIAPDVLRKAAKAFTSEEEVVKLQTVNLAAKLCITNPKQTKVLCQYTLNMAKYDQNYDIRDRARFLRQLVLPAEATALSKYAKKILLAAKPAPVLESAYKGRAHYQLGSLAHFVNTDTSGYLPLPEFPEVPPDPTVRNVEDDSYSFWGRPKSGDKKKKNFYEDTESESDFYSSISGSEVSGSETGSGEGSESGSGSEESGSEEEESEEESEEETSSDEGDVLENLKKRFIKKPEEDESETDSEEGSSSEESESEESSTEEEATPTKPKSKPPTKKVVAAAKKSSKPEEPSLLLLDDWDAVGGPAPSGTLPSMATGDMLTPTASGGGMEVMSPSGRKEPTYQIVNPYVVPTDTHELLNRIRGEGLSVTYRFTRKPHIAASNMLSVELTFQNTLETTLSGICIGATRLQSGMKLKNTASPLQLPGGSSKSISVGIDFNDTMQPAKFDMCMNVGKKYPVQVDPLVGELLRAIHTTESGFLSFQEKLTGMHENSSSLSIEVTPEIVKTAVLQVANMAPVDCSDASTMRFAAVTFSTGLPVLLTVKLSAGGAKMTANSEKMVFNSMLLKTVKAALSTSA